MQKVRTSELGIYGGRTYYLTTAVEPDPSDRHRVDRDEDADDWCVSAHYPGGLPNESDTEIARIDTEHGRPHFHRLYLRDQPISWFSTDLSLAAAENLLAAEWEAYAELYEEHHASG